MKNRLMSIADYSLQKLLYIVSIPAVRYAMWRRSSRARGWSWISRLCVGGMISLGMVCGRVRRRNARRRRDPHQLRMNSYRVLLTRGRDGFIVFVPNEIGMRSTYEVLKGAGVREIGTGNILTEKENTGVRI